jgi:hypothetical protein
LSDWRIKGHMLHFVMSFLKNRKFRVAVGAEMSTMRNKENGVVQGDVLSVTFFLISMSQINKNIDSPSKIIDFADDWIIYTRHLSLQTAQTNIQAVVDKISPWARNIEFQISLEKTTTKTQNHSTNTSNPQITLDGRILELVPNHKILGVFFDSQLN